MFVLGTGASAAPGVPIAPIEMFASHAEAASVPERIHVRSETMNVLAGHAMSATGSLRPRLRGAKVSLRLLLGRRWVAVAHARSGPHGGFTLRYVTPRTGSWLAQVRYSAPAGVGDATHRLGVLSAFRAADASWYGGGGGLACGGELTSYTMGVANKTLPCGTWLTIRYGDRSVRVQVIDRGPYVAGREFDLTEATKRALGFEGVGIVWATR
jgi:hypothetical protein